MSELYKLAETIASRRSADPRLSWTAKLLASGRERCAQKFGEEAIETVIAGSTGDKKSLASEAADSIYHLLVLLEANGVPLRDVLDELRRRENSSGIAEKRSRPES
ncbi:MAG: phosphoribosyl-ATP diphosphatase [Albidovulum sp.]|nr:phosphoribosyl-ATP diphosphatase [Albidovulum sp.]MDE0304530.1 phosphoribosyl-ATP diphosphatase [Albidovulum sp.]MDE0531435.1 phosphoribosyl-ATP diphosphatase [Albidovulum sp.]